MDAALTQSILQLIISEDILKDFQVEQVKELPEHIELILHEKKDRVPEALKEKKAVLDGFCNPFELQSFPLKGKALFIKLYRRRWKEKGTQKHYSNQYDLNDEGVKATRQFGAFLKEDLGQTPSEFQRNRDRIVRGGK